MRIDVIRFCHMCKNVFCSFLILVALLTLFGVLKNFSNIFIIMTLVEVQLTIVL